MSVMSLNAYSRYKDSLNSSKNLANFFNGVRSSIYKSVVYSIKKLLRRYNLPELGIRVFVRVLLRPFIINFTVHKINSAIKHNRVL